MATVVTKKTTLLDDRSGTTFRASEAPTDVEVRLSLSAWNELGRPDEITVTVEPGDRLNDADEVT